MIKKDDEATCVLNICLHLSYRCWRGQCRCWHHWNRRRRGIKCWRQSCDGTKIVTTIFNVKHDQYLLPWHITYRCLPMSMFTTRIDTKPRPLLHFPICIWQHSVAILSLLCHVPWQKKTSSYLPHASTVLLGSFIRKLQAMPSGSRFIRHHWSLPAQRKAHCYFFSQPCPQILRQIGHKG